MNRITRQFVNLILEKEEKKEEKKKKEPKEKDSSNYPLFKVMTDNQLSRGRPISDPSLANMKYRANGEPEDAQAMLKELGLSSTGNNVYEVLQSTFKMATTSEELRILIASSDIVKSPSGKLGVKIGLKGIWKQDDKGGKRTFGFIRAIIAATGKAGYLGSDTTTIKNLRVEEAIGENALIAYSSKRAKSWGA